MIILVCNQEDGQTDGKDSKEILNGLDKIKKIPMLHPY
jgi:hypothetical protein